MTVDLRARDDREPEARDRRDRPIARWGAPERAALRALDLTPTSGLEPTSLARVVREPTRPFDFADPDPEAAMSKFHAVVRSLPFVLASFLLAPGCSGSTDTPATPGEPAHASESVAPGSHEDWCGEHQVPESLCTRCNPTLIPAFQATGDWCPEHGLPESQCLICNPDLRIERPAAEGS